MPRSTRLAAEHPILTYVGTVALFAVLYVVIAITTGGRFKIWGIFVVGGVLLPIAQIAKARRQYQDAHSDE